MRAASGSRACSCARPAEPARRRDRVLRREDPQVAGRSTTAVCSSAARGLFPWGFVEESHALASEGAKTIAYEIAEQLGWELPDAVISPAASGTLFAKLAQGFDELNALGAATGTRRACTAHKPEAARHSRRHGPTTGRCRRCCRTRRCGRSRSAILPTANWRSALRGCPGERSSAIPEEEIAESTNFFAQMTGVHADSAGGVAFGALLELVRRGDIHPGERGVLVVTGTGLKPYGYDVDCAPQEVTSDVDDVLAVLGVS